MKWILPALLLLAGCATMPTGPADAPVVVRNTYGKVASETQGIWRIQEPPRLYFTGKTASYKEVSAWARSAGAKAVFMGSDMVYAQLEAGSAVQAILWLKRFNEDTGYTYRDEARDCDNFSRRVRAFADLFDGARGQPAVFGLAVQMDRPFAGISDGNHALNAVWTDEGVFVFEPQGLDLVYQRAEAWPNRRGVYGLEGD